MLDKSIKFIFDKLLLIVSSIIFLFFIMASAVIMDKHSFKKEYIYFFIWIIGWLLIFNWGIISQDLKHKKRTSLLIGIILMIIIELIMAVVLFFLIIKCNIKFYQKGGAYISIAIGLPSLMIAFIIYAQVYRFILKNVKKKYILKGIIETNKFQEKAIVKVEKMLKDLGIKYEEFKKVLEKDEVILQGDVEVNGNYFAITIYEDAISLAAEKDEDVFILELIDYESQNKLIEDFCSKARGIFEKYL